MTLPKSSDPLHIVNPAETDTDCNPEDVSQRMPPIAGGLDCADQDLQRNKRPNALPSVLSVPLHDFACAPGLIHSVIARL